MLKITGVAVRPLWPRKNNFVMSLSINHLWINRATIPLSNCGYRCQMETGNNITKTMYELIGHIPSFIARKMSIVLWSSRLAAS